MFGRVRKSIFGQLTSTCLHRLQICSSSAHTVWTKVERTTKSQLRFSNWETGKSIWQEKRRIKFCLDILWHWTSMVGPRCSYYLQKIEANYAIIRPFKIFRSKVLNRNWVNLRRTGSQVANRNCVHVALTGEFAGELPSRSTEIDKTDPQRPMVDGVGDQVRLDRRP